MKQQNIIILNKITLLLKVINKLFHKLITVILVFINYK